jgi:hypothetical protein
MQFPGVSYYHHVKVLPYHLPLDIEVAPKFDDILSFVNVAYCESMPSWQGRSRFLTAHKNYNPVIYLKSNLIGIKKDPLLKVFFEATSFLKGKNTSVLPIVTDDKSLRS